jgi:hypothetical protein
MDDDSEQLARFEEMGEEAVRIHVHTFSFNTAHQRLAIKWLAQKDQELERRRDASQAEQIDIARSAKDAAWEGEYAEFDGCPAIVVKSASTGRRRHGATVARALAPASQQFQNRQSS